jgi:hypothetical protein
MKKSKMRKGKVYILRVEVFEEKEGCVQFGKLKRKLKKEEVSSKTIRKIAERNKGNKLWTAGKVALLSKVYSRCRKKGFRRLSEGKMGLLCRHLRMTNAQICQKAFALGFHRELPKTDKLEMPKKKKWTAWSPAKVSVLRKVYSECRKNGFRRLPKRKMEMLCRLTGKTRSQIWSKAWSLGFHRVWSLGFHRVCDGEVLSRENEEEE